VWPDGWKPDRSAPRRRDGLTLFEVLVVMTVLAVLVSLVIGLGRHADAAGKRGRAQADLAVWQDALTHWHLAFDAYPVADGTVADLMDAGIRTPATNLLFSATTGQGMRLTDPWGSLYRYRGGDQNYDIRSLGADGRQSADDISPQGGN
jgi:type II secretion system protein G